MKLVLLLSIVLILNIYSSTTLEEEQIVNTHYGMLRGKQMISRSGRFFSAFLGIPYASPPIGELRFFPPTAPQTWEDIRDSTEEGNNCLQTAPEGAVLGSEDCLYLNVFTHSTNSNKVTTVMVYIHGGGFYFGSPAIDYHAGPEYLMDKDIVLVTLQYRLGPFGFLSTEDEVIPGNMGLKDQVKALQWVQENIKAFGGDPAKVTIFGNSVGGSSVHLHMQSPLSRNLFARGISQSGTAFSGFAIAGKDVCKNVTEHLALTLKCLIDNSTEILQCLQNKSSIDILSAYNKQINLRYTGNKILLRATVEENTEQAFLTRNPIEVVTEKPWLVGVNSNEGIFKMTTKRLNKTLNLIKSRFHSYGPELMFFENIYKNRDHAVNLIHKFYFENVSSITDMIQPFEQLVTDSWFVWPTEKAVQKHNGILYYYLYDHQGEHSFAEFYNCPKGFGVSHLDELLVLFTQKRIFPDLNEVDTNISKLIVNMWVNFATNGNPTPHSVSNNPQRNDLADFTWEATNSSDPTYLHIQTNNLSMKKKMFSKRMDFWRRLPLRKEI